MDKLTREIVEIDEELCDGCGLCVPSCAEGAIQIIDGRARLVAENLCDGFGNCLGSCPQDAIRIIEREADEYSEEAVKKHLKAAEVRNPGGPHREPPDVSPVSKTVNISTGPPSHGFAGCPGSAMRSFDVAASPRDDAEQETGSIRSTLTQWPIQLMLVPPTAPFLKGRELLLAADCCPFAYGDFHRRFLRNRSLLVGCPKLDDISFYREKLKAIFRESGCSSVTVMVMEVPCCTGLEIVAREALMAAERNIPLKKIVIGIRGEILYESEDKGLSHTA